MDFKNVTLVKKANVYHGGKVSSRTFYLENGERKTLGFMLAGDYEFGTGAPELMEMLSGGMDVLLPGKTQWEHYGEGQSFNVPGDSKFQVKVADFADYCCSYGDK